MFESKYTQNNTNPIAIFVLAERMLISLEQFFSFLMLLRKLFPCHDDVPVCVMYFRALREAPDIFL